MKIYTGGVVVRKRTVVAGEGVSQGKEITEVVFSTSQGFAAANDETARMKVLSAAIAAKAITDTDIDSQIAPLTVELSAPNVTR